ncbi:MAG: hypothetical protein ACOCX3_03380 [Chloroflexota bacterium]
MTLGRRPTTQSKRPVRGGGGQPPWMVFLLGMALVFGLYYLWTGVSEFVGSDGFGVAQQTVTLTSTPSAIPVPGLSGRGDPVRGQSAPMTPAAAAAEGGLVTLMPTFTPIPECTPFRVNVERANVRFAPNTDSITLDVFEQDDEVCVLGRDPVATDWYLIDLDPVSRRVNEAYIFAAIVEAVNPTPTPSVTASPPPTITAMPSDTPSITPTPEPTMTRDPDITSTPTPTPTATPTLPIQSA